MSGYEKFEAIFIRVCFILYVFWAHVAKLYFTPIGLKVQYINHKPWPYKKMYKRFIDLTQD